MSTTEDADSAREFDPISFAEQWYETEWANFRPREANRYFDEAKTKLERERKAREKKRPPIERRMRCGRPCLYLLMEAQ